MNSEDLDRLKLGATVWNKWREENQFETIDLSKANLEGFIFDGFDLRLIYLADSKLREASFVRANLAGAIFRGADLRNANFQKASLQKSDFVDANLQRANFKFVGMEGANLTGANCNGASFTCSSLVEVEFVSANCQDASFDLSNLGNAIFSNADLRSACFEGAELSHAKFKDAKMGPTNLHRISFSNDHQPLHDFTETIKCDYWLTWGQLRLIGNLPLFSASYTTLGFSIAYINCVDAINRSKAIEFLNYPIGVPHRISLILIASILLAIGSTLYASFCPNRVQEFAETQWVEEFGHSRLQYFSDSWSRKRWLYATFAFTVIGGMVSILLFMEFLFYAIRYLLFPIS
ncbi:MAG: pentapeptide repeat-containing protein [Pirellula sp.]|nr:pentapeptide repeat-containing protein [Pirellula sp.]